MKQIQELLRLFLYVSISVVKSYMRKGEFYPKSKIKQYSLRKTISIANKTGYYAIGLYVKNNSPYVIKTWQGRVRDYGWYDLLQEYHNTKKVQKALEGTSLSAPVVVELIQMKNSISLVTEFVQGKRASQVSKHKREKVIKQVLNTLSKIDDKYLNQQGISMPKRDFLSYIASLPILLLFTITCHPMQFKTLVCSYWEFIKQARHISNKKLYLAHRDVHMDNIVITKDSIVILDWGKAAMTILHYDLVFMYINQETHHLVDKTYRVLSRAQQVFLGNYIAIHHARTMDNRPGYKNEYIQTLKQSSINRGSNHWSIQIKKENNNRVARNYVLDKQLITVK